MNKRGFSIVELMTVFVVIIVITTIAVTAFNVISYENKEQLNVKLEKTIVEATGSYCSSRSTGDNPECADGNTVTLETLVDEGLLDGELTNYVEEIPLDICAEVEIQTAGAYNLDYTFDITDPENFDDDCP